MVRIWGEAERRTLAEMRHDDVVETLVFSPDGQYLATAEMGGKIHVWTVPGGEEIARSLHGDISAVRFTPDGSRLIVGSDDGYVRVLLWRQADLVAEACSRLTRKLTPERWQRLLGNEDYVAPCP
jgi:WD40 repeat protein